MSTEKNSFSIRLDQLLKSKHITQKELANAASVTESAISHYIKGDRIPKSSVLARIANVLNTTSDYLMDGEPQDYPSEIAYAKKLIARNIDKMSVSDKKEINLFCWEIWRNSSCELT